MESLAAGRFEVLHLLGEGGMGAVHAVRDTESGEVLAVKVLRALGGEELLRFKHEFRALQDLRHPNLAALRELVEDAGTWMFTMELVDGVDLLSWLGSPADPERLRTALLQLADGLEALHAAGKVHRDIKPSNVLVSNDGRLVLVDFGLVAETAHGADGAVGTAAYMAPEQAGGLAVGPPADWYAVGCLVYEALTGRLPFDGSAVEVVSHKLQHEPPPPRAIAKVPPELDRLCVELLRFEPERRGGAATVRALLDDAWRDVTPPPVAVPPHGAPRFVGREAELAQLERALADASDGPVAVLIHGESGIGKSALVRELTARLDTVVVLEGRCYERESVRYKAVDGVIDALSRYLARLPAADVAALVPAHTDALLRVFPVLGRVETLARAAHGGEARDPGERRQRMMRALRELFGRLAQRARVVIAIDDLQWADADGLAVLHELVRTPGGPSVLVIATGHSATAARGLPVRELYLGRLDAAASRRLAAALAGETLSQSVLDAIAAESGGHPLFVDELVRHAVERGAPHAARLEEVLHARIERLPAESRLLLELVAVARAPVRCETLARAAELDLPVVVRHLDRLRASHLVRTSGARRGDTAETFHDQVAAAAAPPAGGAQGSRRAALHGRLAAALATVPEPDPEALGFHWAAAGDLARAAVHLRDAADRAAAELAFDRAARLYLRVLELGAGGDDVELYARLGDALAGAGRSAEAAGAYVTASSLAPPARAHRFEIAVADQLLRSGRIAQGIERVERALHHVGLRYPPSPRRALLSLVTSRARVRLRGLGFRRRAETALPPAELERIDLCWSVSTGLSVVDFIRGADFQARHLLLALRAGEPRRVARGMAAEAAFLSASGVAAAPRVAKLLAAAQAIAREYDDAYVDAFCGAVAGISGFLFGRWRQARDRCTQGEIELRERCVGAHWEVSTAALFSMYAAIHLGELAPLQAQVDQLLSEARGHGDLLMSAQLVVGHGAILALAADDPDRVRRESAEAMTRWGQTAFHMPHVFDVWALVQTELYVGDPSSAHARLAAAWPRIHESQVLRVEFVRIVLAYLRGRVALANLDERTAEDAAARLESEAAPWAAPHAAAIGAGLAHLRGDTATRSRLLVDAESGFTAADMTLMAAATRHHRGADRRVEAESIMRDCGVRSPARFAAMLVP